MIKDREYFNKIIHHGKYTKDKNYVIYYIDTSNKNTHFGIAIKKSIGSAVVRNRLKRQTRAIIDENKNLFKNTRDYIIMIRDGCKSSSFSEMTNSLNELMKGD